MKKSLLTTLALLTCILFFGGLISYLPASSAVVEESSTSTEKYINQEKGYSIEYPKDWQKQDIPRLDVVIVAPPKEGDSQPAATMNLVSETVGNSLTLDQFYSESVKHLNEELKNVKIDNSGELKINGLISKWMEYKHELSDNSFEVLQYFLVAHGNVYLITFSSKVDEFPKYRPLFEKIASSFKELPKS